jgi:DNA polymerase-3 subunit gamma/tau
LAEGALGREPARVLARTQLGATVAVMSYVVLARKWRPKYLEEVVGQEHIGRTLRNAIDQNRVAHAFLLCGPRGVGKTSTARILAKSLNCHQGPTPTPCYKCPSCVEISAGNSVDVLEIDGASNRGVGEIRELREGVNYAASRDRFKIYIIDEVHMLTTEAFNALLKTLEEPPAHVKFIFATTEVQKIPVTILSRCQRFDFKRIPVRKIVGWLERILGEENIPAEPAALSLIARQADGGMRDALSLTDQVISFSDGQLTAAQVAEVLGVASRDTLFRFTGSLLSKRVEDALTLLDHVHQSGQDLNLFAAALVAHLRDLAVVRVTQGKNALTDFTDQELETALGQVGPHEPAILHRMFHLMVQAADDMSRSAWPKLQFEMALLKLAAIEPLQPMDLLLKRLEAMEAGLLLGDPTDAALQAAAAALPPLSAPTPRAPLMPPPLAASAPLMPVVPPMPPTAARASSNQGSGEVAQVRASSNQGSGEVAQVRTSSNQGPGEVAQVRASSNQGPGEVAQVRAGDEQPSEEPPRARASASSLPARQSAPPSPEHLRPSGPRAAPSGEALGAEEARAAWKNVVAQVNTMGLAASASAMFTKAHLVSVRPGELALSFPEDLAMFFDERKHGGILEQAAQAALPDLWAGPWRVVVVQRGGEGGQQSLADEADERAVASRQRADQLIRDHEILQRAQQIFGQTQLKVVLDEEENYTWEPAPARATSLTHEPDPDPVPEWTYGADHD